MVRKPWTQMWLDNWKITNQFRGWYFACKWYRLKQSSNLAPQFIIFDARNKLQFRIISYGTEYTQPDVTEDITAWGSLKDATSTNVLMEFVRMEPRPCLKYTTAWSKRNNPHILVQHNVHRIINFIHNQHTKITRFNTNNRFRVDYVIRWKKTWKRSPALPCREEGRIR